METKEQLIDRVRWVGHFESRRQAEKSLKAVLETLARRLPRDKADRFWHYLPSGIELFVRHEKEHEKFSLDEFFDLVAELEQGTFSDAAHHSEAVIGVLQANIPAGELKDILSVLPPEYVEFFNRSRLIAGSIK